MALLMMVRRPNFAAGIRPQDLWILYPNDQTEAMWAIAESTVDDALSPLSADERAQYAVLTAKVKGQLQALAGAAS